MFLGPVLFQACRIYFLTHDHADELSRAMIQTTGRPKRNTTLPSYIGIKQVPRILHRTWKTDDLNSMPQKWSKAYNHCTNIYKDFMYDTILWTDESMRDFISNRYPWFMNQYDSYPYHIQRVDAARYLILYHYGGIYQDLDIKCEKSLERIRRVMASSQKEVLIPQTKPIGFSNDVMMATQGNLFFLNLIDSLSTRNRWYGSPYLTVMFSTGPMFLSTVYHHLHHEEKSQIAILPHEMYSMRTKDSTLRFFTHLHGSSWHGTDVVFLRFFQRRVVPNLFYMCLVGAIILLMN
jgi:mannosyltransferase OCH1-like enzyme